MMTVYVTHCVSKVCMLLFLSRIRSRRSREPYVQEMKQFFDHQESQGYVDIVNNIIISID